MWAINNKPLGKTQNLNNNKLLKIVFSHVFSKNVDSHLYTIFSIITLIYICIYIYFFKIINSIIFDLNYFINYIG